jgi:NifU-like protein involved in Fe-S cluster formation
MTLATAATIPQMPADALPPALRAAFDAARHVGPPPGAALRGEARNAACGDIVVLWLATVAEGDAHVVRAAGFKAQGCPAAMVTAAAACEVLPGLQADATLADELARRFQERFGTPKPAHGHALALLCEAARAAR